MRSRWHDRVIVIAIFLLAVTGVLAIWGNDLRRLLGDERDADLTLPAEIR